MPSRAHSFTRTTDSPRICVCTRSSRRASASGSPLEHAVGRAPSPPAAPRSAPARGCRARPRRSPPSAARSTRRSRSRRWRRGCRARTGRRRARLVAGSAPRPWSHCDCAMEAARVPGMTRTARRRLRRLPARRRSRPRQREGRRRVHAPPPAPDVDPCEPYWALPEIVNRTLGGCVVVRPTTPAEPRLRRPAARAGTTPSTAAAAPTAASRSPSRTRPPAQRAQIRVEPGKTVDQVASSSARPVISTAWRTGPSPATISSVTLRARSVERSSSRPPSPVLSMNSIPDEVQPQPVAVLGGLGHGGAQLADVREVDLARSGHDGGTAVPRGADGEVVVHWCR